MKKAYIKGLRMLEEFRKLDPDMPTQLAATFLTIANEEGVTMKTIGDRLGISQSSCSRHVSILSKRYSIDKLGHDLVYAIEDPAERRRKIVFLTPKGKRVAESLLAILED